MSSLQGRPGGAGAALSSGAGPVPSVEWPLLSPLGGLGGRPVGQGHEVRKSQASWDSQGLIEHLLDTSGDLSDTRG